MTDNELIISSYKAALKDLRKRYKDMDTEHSDKKTISGMIYSLEYSLYWLKNGCEKPPNRDISQRSYEQRTEYWADVSLVTQYNKNAVVLINEQIEESDLSIEEKYFINTALSLMAPREYELFIDIYVNEFTFREAAKINGLKSSQSQINRAKMKINNMLEIENTEICLFA